MKLILITLILFYLLNCASKPEKKTTPDPSPVKDSKTMDNSFKDITSPKDSEPIANYVNNTDYGINTHFAKISGSKLKVIFSIPDSSLEDFVIQNNQIASLTIKYKNSR